MFMDILLHTECPKCNYKKALQELDNTIYCTECGYNGVKREEKSVTVKDYII
jgi:uncharacterized Zn finger protein (UPF0148 family)